MSEIEHATNCNSIIFKGEPCDCGAIPSHTPGPWHQTEKEQGNLEIWSKNRCVAMTPVRLTWDEEKANARLIAAAPELLEALIYLRFEAAKQITHRNDSGCDALRKAVEAIAKAKGKD